VNVLERTQEFDNAYWTKFAGGTAGVPVVTANDTSAPDGTTTADKIVFNVGAGTTASDRCEVLKSGLARVSGQSNAGSIWLRGSVGGEQIVLRTSLASNYQLQTLTTSWQRFSTAGVATATDSSDEFGFGIRQGQSFGTINATATIFAWQAQREVGTVSTADQRVTTAFDVTEAGQRDCYGVRADGTDDGYLSPSITWGNQITVFAALRKSSDVDRGLVLENVDGGVTATGVFNFNAPLAASPTVAFRSSGSSSATAEATLAAPVTFVSSAVGNIATDTCLLRINGAQVATSVADQGTGNYTAGALRLFRRDGNAIPFNGNLYALIVAGGSYPLSTIQRVERILSRITPTVNL
jgi:hypothetical protein